jgi:hypothetical protein
MTDDPPAPIRHRVEVPLGGLGIADLRAQADRAELDPDQPEVRALLSLQQPETAWIAAVTFEVGTGGAVPVGVELRSTIGQAVSRKAWDAVKVATVIDQARATAAWLAPVTGRQAPAELAEPVRTGRRGRPATYTDDFYRRVARMYQAAEKVGQRPLRSVARAFESEYPGLADSGDNRVKSWAAACRARGLLQTRAENEK